MEGAKFVLLLAFCFAHRSCAQTGQVADLLPVNFQGDALSGRLPEFSAGPQQALLSVETVVLTTSSGGDSAYRISPVGLLAVNVTTPRTPGYVAGAGCAVFEVVSPVSGVITLIADWVTWIGSPAVDAGALAGSLCQGNCTKGVKLDPNGKYVVVMYRPAATTTTTGARTSATAFIDLNFFSSNSTVCKGLPADTAAPPPANTSLWTSTFANPVLFSPDNTAPGDTYPSAVLSNATCIGLGAYLLPRSGLDGTLLWLVAEPDALAFLSGSAAPSAPVDNAVGSCDLSAGVTDCQNQLTTFTGLDPTTRYYVIVTTATDGLVGDYNLVLSGQQADACSGGTSGSTTTTGTGTGGGTTTSSGSGGVSSTTTSTTPTTRPPVVPGRR